MRMGDMPQQNYANLAQQVDMPQLDLVSIQAVPIWKQVPHCLLRAVEHHVYHPADWEGGQTSLDSKAVWESR